MLGLCVSLLPPGGMLGVMPAAAVPATSTGPPADVPYARCRAVCRMTLLSGWASPPATGSTAPPGSTPGSTPGRGLTPRVLRLLSRGYGFGARYKAVNSKIRDTRKLEDPRHTHSTSEKPNAA